MLQSDVRVPRPGRGLPDGGQDLAQARPADGGRPLQPEVLRPPPRPGDLHQPRLPGRGLRPVLLVDNLSTVSHNSCDNSRKRVKYFRGLNIQNFLTNISTRYESNKQCIELNNKNVATKSVLDENPYALSTL